MFPSKEQRSHKHTSSVTWFATKKNTSDIHIKKSAVYCIMDLQNHLH